MPTEILKDLNSRNECEIGIDNDTMKVVLPSDGVLISDNGTESEFVIKTVNPLMKAVGIAKLDDIFYSTFYGAYAVSLLGKLYPNSLNRKFYSVFISKSSPGMTNVFDQIENINPLMISINSKEMVEITLMSIDVTTKLITPITNNKSVVEIIPDFSVVYDKTLFESIFTPLGLDIKTFIIPFINYKIVTSNGSISFDIMDKSSSEVVVNQFNRSCKVKYFADMLNGMSAYLRLE